MKVFELMSRQPVLVAPELSVHESQTLAQERDVHHLLVSEQDALIGMVCLCDLEGLELAAPVGRAVGPNTLCISPAASAAEAASMMEEHGIGCLPVVDARGRLCGVLTRRDLRDAGVMSTEGGFEACAACGSMHGLTPSATDQPRFCAACRARMKRDEFDYVTLGGGD
jgi:acetoin utilization protein AcuB